MEIAMEGKYEYLSRRCHWIIACFCSPKQFGSYYRNKVWQKIVLCPKSYFAP
jgi:hypothetical protein